MMVAVCSLKGNKINEFGTLLMLKLWGSLGYVLLPQFGNLYMKKRSPGVENANTLRCGYLGLNFKATNTATPAPRL